MLVWRIAKQSHALDRLGKGAMISGGRWNSINVAVVYAGLNVEIAAFEKLVHVSGPLPDDLVLVSIAMPDDDTLYYRLPSDQLPENWDAMPSSASAQELGNAFIRDAKYLGMIVPSVIIPEANNIIINPNHPQWGQCVLNIKRKFSYDPRLNRNL